MWVSVKAAEDAMTGRPGGSGAAASRKEKAPAGGKNGLEERLGGTLRYHEILEPNGPNVVSIDRPLLFVDLKLYINSCTARL
jgi:transcriptional adapter 3